MTALSLLQIVKRATGELGLPQPAAVFANTDPQVVQLFTLSNAAGYDLLKVHDWSFLQTVGTITLAIGQTSYTLPTDFDRMVTDTIWDRSDGRRVAGPDTPQANRQLLESGFVRASTSKRFRVLGTTISIFPTPTAVETVAFEYVSNGWATAAFSTFSNEFQADTDASVFDSQLMVKELKWRFMNAKGMYADGLKAEADNRRDLCISSDIGGTVLSMLPDNGPGFLSLDNIQDGNFN